VKIKNILFVVVAIIALTITLAVAINPIAPIKIAFAQNRSQILKNHKKEIQDQLNQIQIDLKKIGENFTKVREKRNTLNEQILAMQDEIKEIDDLILQTRTTVAEIGLEIQRKQNRIEELNQQSLRLLIEIQKFQHTSFLQTIFTSENFGELISKMYSLSSLESQMKDLEYQIRQETADLVESRQQQIETERILNQTRSAAKARTSDLASLIAQTEGEESKYQQLLDTLNKQEEDLEVDLNILEGNYLSHLVEISQKDLAPGDCKFEAGETLDVPTDYFTRPTRGFMTQGFHCGHDGIDIANSAGTELYAIADGVVERIGANNDGCVGIACNGGFGNFILVKHNLPSGQRIYSLVAHMQTQSFLSEGDRVKKGQVIGYMGCTGYTKPYPCGVHTHFVMYSDSYETHGLGCRLGRSKCYNPLKYVFPIS
jgi:murein DD-endopeptidase MepM/ murein hydrolase activator NlpD